MRVHESYVDPPRAYLGGKAYLVCNFLHTRILINGINIMMFFEMNVAIASYSEANKGKKVEFIKTETEIKYLNPGDTGTYQRSFKIPAMPTQHLIYWDNGSQRILLEGVDNFKFIDKA